MRIPDPRLNDGYKEIRIRFPKKIYRRIKADIFNNKYKSFNDAVITLLEANYIKETK